MKIKFVGIILAFFLLLQNVYGGEKNLYDFNWLDPDKKIYVLQNKIYKKANSFYANVGFGSNDASEFQSITNYHGRLGYFISEEWGVEVYYSKLSNSDNDVFKNLVSISSAFPFVRRVNSYYGAMGIFSPFYGKFNVFNKIIYFDWNFGLGASKVDLEDNKEGFNSRSPTISYTKRSYTALSYKTELRVYMWQYFHFSVDFMYNYMKADAPVGAGKENFTMKDVLFSVGIHI